MEECKVLKVQKKRQFSLKTKRVCDKREENYGRFILLTLVLNVSIVFSAFLESDFND